MLESVVPSSTWEPTPDQIDAIRTEVLDWFRQNGRSLPWRSTRDPYRVLVSEVMLQQTQVPRVVAYYTRFLEVFPSPASVASAGVAGVVRVWQGLGYNRRALYLKRACDRIETELDGEFPRDVAGLLKLPGVGSYTARAVACFAFDAQVAVVDTNVTKAISAFALRFAPSSSVHVAKVADDLLPVGSAYEWNQAFMDYGAMAVKAGPLRTREDLSAKPFRDTDRFWRGRIIAALCAHPERISMSRLLDELPDDREDGRVLSLMRAMQREGLVIHEEREGWVSLT